MMDTKMEVYTPLLELVGILEVHRSVIWEEKAFGAGSFSIDSLITAESKTLLVPGNIVWIADNYAGVIEYVQEQSGKDGPYITVKGPDLTGILGQRILWGQYNLTGTAPAIMHSLVNDSCISPTRGDTEARKIPGLVSLDVPIGGDAIRVQKTGGTLLEALEELGAAFGVAFGVRFNPAIPRMEFWTRWGQNRGINQTTNDPVFYSTELDDVMSSEYSYNAQDYRNVALVAGEGEGGDRVTVTVNADVAPTPVPPAPGTKYTITLSVDPEGGGTATGGGQINEGESVTVTATPSDGYNFSGWQENGQTVSTDTTYIFTATGNRTLVAVFAVASRLPDGYTELEYIQSSGTQYIDTGVIPNNDTRVTAKFRFISATTNFFSIFGVEGADGYNGYMLFGRNGQTGVQGIYGDEYYSVTEGAYSTSVPNEIDINGNSLTLDGKTQTLTAQTFTCDAPIYLFGSDKYSSNGTSAPQQLTSAAFYSFAVYDNGVLIRNFIPCSNPTGAIGLYDLVGGTFYANAGTGTFTAGPIA